MLAKQEIIKNNVNQVTVFGGLNTTRNCSIAEFSKTKNLNCDEFPLLQSDGAMGYTESSEVNGFYKEVDVDGVIYVLDNSNLPYLYKKSSTNKIQIGTYPFDDETEVTTLGNKIIVTKWDVGYIRRKDSGQHVLIRKRVTFEYDTGTNTLNNSDLDYTKEKILSGYVLFQFPDGARVQNHLKWNDGGTSDSFIQTCGTWTSWGWQENMVCFCAGDNTYVRINYTHSGSGDSTTTRIKASKVNELDLVFIIPKEYGERFNIGDKVYFRSGVSQSDISSVSLSYNSNADGCYINDKWTASTSTWTGIGSNPVALSIRIGKDMLNSLNLGNFIYNEITLVDGWKIKDHHALWLSYISLFRSGADISYITGVNNRLWGYSESEQSAYASELGRLYSFSKYEGTAQDSWSATLGETGKITGIGVYNNNPVYFSENTITLVNGSRPSNYQFSTFKANGVKKGCHRSIVQINGALYYHSPYGIYKYNGSLPKNIGENVFSKEWENTIASKYKDNYYIYVPNKQELYCYDTIKNIWHQKECGDIVDFLESNNDLAIYEVKDNVRYKRFLTSYETELFDDYQAITGDLFGDILDKKYLKQIRISAELEKGSELKAYVEYDRNGRWEQVATIQVPKRQVWKKTIQNIKRADTYRLKLEGKGKVHIYGIEYTTERCEE